MNMTHEKPDRIRPIGGIKHYPLERTILAHHQSRILQHVRHRPYTERPYDLIFGGATRDTHRRKRIEYYYNSVDNYIFGNLRGVRCPDARIGNRVSFQSFINEMTKGKATVIVASKFYNNNFFTLRMYESLLADCMVFIDHQMDTKEDWYGGLYPEFYVEHPSEIDLSIDTYTAWEDWRHEMLASYHYKEEQEALREAIKR